MKNTELEAIIDKYDLVGKSHKETLKVVNDNLLDWTVLAILSYINQHYAIKPDVMRELKKDENVRRILEGGNDLSKELYLTLFNDIVTTPIAIRVTDYELGLGFGFDTCGVFKKNNKWNWKKYPQYWRKSTPEEIQSMLVKKLEADGLKVGCKIVTTWHCAPFIINKFDFIYDVEGDSLLCDGWLLYKQGKFAKIIQPELTIEQRLERLEKHLKID